MALPVRSGGVTLSFRTGWSWKYARGLTSGMPARAFVTAIWWRCFPLPGRGRTSIGWRYFPPARFPPWRSADRTLVVEAQSAGCALFLAQGAQQPFIAGPGLGKAVPPPGKTPVDCQVYSLAEVEDFFACLPYLCAAAGLAVGTLLLWVWSWKLRGQALAWNTAWAAALLVAVFFPVAGSWHFHPSLLPRGNVFDFSHLHPGVFPRSSPLLRSPL